MGKTRLGLLFSWETFLIFVLTGIAVTAPLGSIHSEASLTRLDVPCTVTPPSHDGAPSPRFLQEADVKRRFGT